MGKGRAAPLIRRSVDPSPRRSVDPSVVIAIHVQPRAARTEVVGMHGDAVKIRIKAPPVDGAANDELVRLVATRLGVRRRDVEIVGGATARAKRVLVRTTLDEAAVVHRLCAGHPPRP
jgi:uncharacterized protein (TIGR00251 family)